MCNVVVIIGCCRYIQSFYQQVALTVFYRRDERISFTVFLAEYYILVDPSLDFLVEMRIIEAEHQTVCPVFVHNSYFSDNSFVVEHIVETFYVVNFLFVCTFGYAIFAKFGDIVVNIIIVIRIVLESIYLVH